MTCESNAWSFVLDLGRPITLLSPKNMPGTHQYAVTLVAQIVAQVWRLFWRSLLVDKMSWYMRFFLILPNKYYTFVTSPFLSASPSPAPFCSIFRGPNRLDLWLDLCLKLLFDCQNLWKVTNGVAGDISRECVVIFVRFWEADHPLITKKSARNPPICGHACGANCGADVGVLFNKNLVAKVSWYMRCCLSLPNNSFTFVTSTFLSASPSPAPVSYTHLTLPTNREV